MFFWFLGVAFVAVVLVFNSPALDYRMVMLGSVLPLTDYLWPRIWPMHTLLWPVGVMGVVMLVTQNRRLVRRRWLGLPIGMFMYLVLSGAWQLTEIFWWPGFGQHIDAESVPSLPSSSLALLMEAVGLGALAWGVVRFQLHEADDKARFLRTGQLRRDLIDGPENSC